MREWILILVIYCENKILVLYLVVNKILMKILGSLIHYNLSGIFLLLAHKSDNFSNETCLIICFINTERKMMR